MRGTDVYVLAVLLGWTALLSLGGMLLCKTAKSTSRKVVLSIVLGLGAIWLSIATVSVDALPYVRAKAERQLCMTYLQQMGLGIQLYREDFNNQLPSSLETLTTQYTPNLEPPAPFVPTLEPPILYIGKTRVKSPDDYAFYYWPRENLKPHDMLCWDALPRVIHHGILRFMSTSQRLVLFTDLHVEAMREPDFQKLYAKQTGQK